MTNNMAQIAEETLDGIYTRFNKLDIAPCAELLVQSDDLAALARVLMRDESTTLITVGYECDSLAGQFERLANDIRRFNQSASTILNLIKQTRECSHEQF